jgi:hypothetical protein
MLGRELYFYLENTLQILFVKGFVNFLKELDLEVTFTAIAANYPGLDAIAGMTDIFSKVIRVGYCTYEGDCDSVEGKSRLICSGIPKAQVFAKELDNIEFPEPSIVFIHAAAYSLTSAIALKVFNEKRGVKTVLLYPTWDSHINHFMYDESMALMRNKYMDALGCPKQDVFKLRFRDKRNSKLGQWVYREPPVEHTFWLRHAFGEKKLCNDEIYYPFYFPASSIHPDNGDVLVCGQAFDTCYSFINLDTFYDDFNLIIDLIREKHSGQKLLYKKHPQEREENLKMDLDGFEIVDSSSSEQLVMDCKNISDVYGVTSNSCINSLYLGVRSFFLVNLFKDESIQREVKKYFTHRHDDLPDRMHLNSIEEWLDGKCDYVLPDVSSKISCSIRKLFNRLNIMN